MSKGHRKENLNVSKQDELRILNLATLCVVHTPAASPGACQGTDSQVLPYDSESTFRLDPVCKLELANAADLQTPLGGKTQGDIVMGGQRQKPLG
jgi:hypothetical protein